MRRRPVLCVSTLVGVGSPQFVELGHAWSVVHIKLPPLSGPRRLLPGCRRRPLSGRPDSHPPARRPRANGTGACGRPCGSSTGRPGCERVVHRCPDAVWNRARKVKPGVRVVLAWRLSGGLLEVATMNGRDTSQGSGGGWLREPTAGKQRFSTNRTARRYTTSTAG